MIRSFAGLALAIAATASAPAALAQGSPNQLCIYQGPTQRPAATSSSVPIWKVTAFGEGSTSSSATQAGKIKWSDKAKQGFGQTFSYINRARFVNVSCSFTGTPFKPKYICWVSAQPCN